MNFSQLLPFTGSDISMIRLPAYKEKNVIKNIADLYDILADAVDEINSIFSREVKTLNSNSND